ncbi:hypothetical protein ACFE33_01810 [Falsihalocynthiibacter sp. SS001]|uniref:hypothetical protein n=1 Tax=Falsihalocynthiibacter sp. SS001 TaxID=3349698 RepID=UPI0036D3A3D3
MRFENKCPVCWSEADKHSSANDTCRFECERCGTFKVSRTAERLLEISAEKFLSQANLFGKTANSDLAPNNTPFAASLGHWLQDQQRYNLDPLLISETVTRHTEKPYFPSIETQIANLLRVIGNHVGEPGPERSFEFGPTQFKVGCKTREGVVGLAKHLSEMGQIEFRPSKTLEGITFSATMTVAGWIEYERILADNKVGRKAFIAMPFGKRDLDDEWLPSLRNAVAQTGYELERVDDKPKSGLIDTRMKLQIKAARFLLVELTHSNLGAYWEAGMAEGLGKPVIYLRRSNDLDKAHFDVEHSFRVQWDAHDLEPALETLKATIRNTMPDAIMTDDTDS